MQDKLLTRLQAFPSLLTCVCAMTCQVAQVDGPEHNNLPVAQLCKQAMQGYDAHVLRVEQVSVEAVVGWLLNGLVAQGRESLDNTGPNRMRRA